jgi:hypothetical protein
MWQLTVIAEEVAFEKIDGGTVDVIELKPNFTNQIYVQNILNNLQL